MINFLSINNFLKWVNKGSYWHFAKLFFLFCYLIVFQGKAQLSPGKLSQAHSKLEGLANCTKCHSIGDKVANQNCLACHKELSSRISRNKGFHASVAIKGKDCIVCHSEHHGVNFDMVRFDKKTFNHSLTGYELKGTHKTKAQNCNECHKPEHIVEANLRGRAGTFLGLDTKCLTCHEDFHQKTLSNDCASCHDFTDFKNAPLFNHNNTSFALQGEHKKLDCSSCHKSEIRNNKKFVKFSGVGFSNCSSCHKDEHKGKFGGNCESCHTEESFHKISQPRSFNHSVTGYILEGKHKDISCKKCHENSFGSGHSFQEFAQNQNITCVKCHKDIHEGKLGADCKVCHNQNSFLLKSKSFAGKFDHDKTDYPLQGKHQTVDCKMCHKGDLTDPVLHNSCTNCHSDKHKGDFIEKKDKYPDCATCHSAEGFTPSKFTIEQHNKSAFKLEGAHLAQPCFACHLIENQWTFAKMNTTCVGCHKNIHEGKIDSKCTENQSCTFCHQTDTWQNIKFDHKITGYFLTGKHSTANCGACHFDKKSNPTNQIFKGQTKVCANCHQDIHGKQFSRNGVTDCSRCHNTQIWDSSSFNHDKTTFKLDGKHQSVACSQCHKESLKGNPTIKLFKLPKHQCIDCHL